MNEVLRGSLTTLKSLSDPAQIAALNSLGVYTVSQLAEWPPARDAELLLSIAAGGDADAIKDAVELYMDADKQIEEATTELISNTQHYDLKAVDDPIGDLVEDELGLKTIGDLAAFAPYLEARSVTQACNFPPYCVRPSAPDWLLPDPVGATQMKTRMSNYVKDMPFDFQQVGVTYLGSVNEPVPYIPVAQLFTRASFKGWMGYLALFRQRWVNAGTNLGEVVHSLALAPGESRNIAVVDWFSRQQSSRDEDSTATETLTATFQQTRAVNEVVEATAVEHLYGQTEIDSTTKTTGFGLTGGYGGGSAVNNTVGGAAELDLMQLVELPIDVAAQGATSNTNTHAGSIGGSYVTSKGTLQGTIKSESGGSRDVLGEVTQNISDATVQNASNVRSLFSTVIVEDTQQGSQAGSSRNVTNYNHSHALTVQYYEILQKYIVTTRAEETKPVVYLPFKPMPMSIESIILIWSIVKPLVKSRVPEKVDEWDIVLRNYNATNEAFDPEGEIKITQIQIDRSRTYRDPCQVELDDANPKVKFSVRGSRLQDSIDLVLTGGSTYIDYDILAVSSKTEVTNIDTDENLVWSFTTDFKADLKRELKELINSASKVAEVNMDFNDIGLGSNRDNLEDDVDSNKYRLLNGSSGVDVTIDIKYTLTDENGNSQVVPQTKTFFFSWSSLHGGNVSGTIDANTEIEAYLDGVADINPTRTIDDILDWFRFHKYGVTKYLLTRMENEQIVDAIEHLGLGNVPLTRFIDPNPLGMVDNYLIFCLRDPRVEKSDLPQTSALSLTQTQPRIDVSPTAALPVGTRNSEQEFAFRVTIERTDGVGKKRITTGRGTAKTTGKGKLRLLLNGDRTGSKRINSLMDIEIAATTGEPRTTFSGSFTRDLAEGGSIALTGSATRPDQKHFLQAWAELPVPRALKPVEHRMDIQLLDVIPTGGVGDGPVAHQPDVPPKEEEDDKIAPPMIQYLDGLDDYLESQRKSPQVEVIYLPTPGVFGEAVLGRSNASEFIDPYRFHNWQDRPIPNAAPGIMDLDLNADRIREISEQLGPEVPLSVTLSPLAPTNYAMPTGLTEAMTTLRTPDLFRDMSKADVLGSAVEELAKVAQSVAEKAGDLSGEAAKSALEQAVSLGNKTADIAGDLARDLKAPPPRTATERVATMNELQRQSENPAPPPTQDPAPIDVAKAETMGADVGGGGDDGGGGTPSPGGPAGNDDGPLDEGACEYDNEAEILNSYSSPYLVYETGVNPLAHPDGEINHEHWNLYTHSIANFGVGQAHIMSEKWTQEASDAVLAILERASIKHITYAPSQQTYYALGLRITGYADCAGDAQANANLREQRANQTVALFRAFLEAHVADGGTDFENLNVDVLIRNGGAAPAGIYMSGNDSVDGRSQNRGVEVEEFWYPLDISQVPQDLINQPADIDTRLEIGEEVVRQREQEIKDAVMAIEGKPQHILNSADCVLQKALRTDTQMKYYSVGAVNTYVADGIWQEHQIAPVDYGGATDARNKLYLTAYSSPDSERIAQELAATYEAILLGTARAHMKLTLSAVGDPDIVVLTDWIKEQQRDPQSIYTCHLGEVTENLEWF